MPHDESLCPWLKRIQFCSTSMFICTPQIWQIACSGCPPRRPARCSRSCHRSALLRHWPRSKRRQVPELVAGLAPKQLADLFQRLQPQETVDLLQELPPATRRDTLATLPSEYAANVRALLRYREDTAGGIMSNRFIALQEDMSVEAVREMLRPREKDERAEDIAYLYVTDAAHRLVGIVSLRDLVFRRPERRMSEIMNRDVKFVRADTDQEELARQFEHYHYLGLPVLDAENRLVGVVKASDALEIARKEATEDMQLMVGLSGRRTRPDALAKVCRPAVALALHQSGTAFAAAAVVSVFEGTIARWTALAVFLPVIAGQGGNAGMQTLTVIIRDLALGELSLSEGRKALFKEMMLGLGERYCHRASRRRHRILLEREHRLGHRGRHGHAAESTGGGPCGRGNSAGPKDAAC